MPESPMDIEALLQDESFVRWVLSGRAEDNSVWAEHIRRFPEQEATIWRARKELALIAAGITDWAREEDWTKLRLAIEGTEETGRKAIRARGRLLTLRRIGIAAAIAGLLGIGAWWLTRSRIKKTEPNATAKTVADIPPGGNTAILTLATGQRILLDTAATGLLAKQGASDVRKAKDGELEYSKAGAGEAIMNTLSTPRGGQYQLILADGSKVWLNAATSITYPTAFAGQRREVTVTGEAYFEVAPNAKQPFVVKSSGAEVEVLGTMFDIMAYSDEPELRATLISGAVRVSRGGEKVTLRPGDQARLAPASSGIKVVKNIDTGEVIAWTTGFFPFEELDLSTILREIGRWYDIEIEDRAGPEAHQRRFGGRIKRDLPLSGTLKLLESKNIHYRLEGRKLIVLP